MAKKEDTTKDDNKDKKPKSKKEKAKHSEKRNKTFVIIGFSFILLIFIVFAIFLILHLIRASNPASIAVKNRYKEFIETVRTGDFHKIRTFISKVHQPMYDKWDEKQFEENGRYVRDSAPTVYKIIRVDVQGDTAKLWLEGNAKNLITGGSANYGEITFKLESGEWKILKEHWADKPENLGDENHPWWQDKIRTWFDKKFGKSKTSEKRGK